jgi:hypothetical protein
MTCKELQREEERFIGGKRLDGAEYLDYADGKRMKRDFIA